MVKQKGAAIAEYVLGVAVLMLAIFFVPYGEQNVAEMLYEALKNSYSSFLYALSVPI